MEKKQGKLLKIYIGESDKYGGKPLYKYILELAKKEGIAGSTIFRGMAGFGKTSVIHSTSILRFSTDLPILIEIVDLQEKIDHLKGLICEVMEDGELTGGLITEEKVDILFYRGNEKQ